MELNQPRDEVLSSVILLLQLMIVCVVHVYFLIIKAGLEAKVYMYVPAAIRMPYGFPTDRQRLIRITYEGILNHIDDRSFTSDISVFLGPSLTPV